MSKDASASIPIVEFRNVSVRFGAFTAVHEISFSIRDNPQHGEFITIIAVLHAARHDRHWKERV